MNHEFEALIIMKLRYDASPWPGAKPVLITADNAKPGQRVGDTYIPDWEPNIAVPNARDLDEIDHAPGGDDEEEEEKPTKGGVDMQTSTKHYEATFIKSLDLRTYPFDSQVLEILVVGDKKSILTHWMDRESDGNPKLTTEEEHSHNKHAAPHRYIKAVVDDDVLPEWEVSEWKEFRSEGVQFGVPVPVVCDYEFKEHVHVADNKNTTNTKLEFRIYVERRWRPIFMATIFPMMLLSCSSMVVYSMEITINQGNRFSALFTIVLTIVANTIVLDGNLPKVFLWTVFHPFIYI